MDDIIMNKDLRMLMQISGQLADDYILHKIAKTHELDFLFACICIGCNQTKRDQDGKVFSDYLEDWEYQYIKQRHRAVSIGKAWINVYNESYASYVSYGYSLSSKPMLSLIWDNDLGVDMLAKILDAGVDLDNKYIQDATPPQEYQLLLAKYGWIPTVCNDITIKSAIETYYPTNVWDKDQLSGAKITIKPIGEPPFGVIGKTIVCISDTHWGHRSLHIPGGDILICSGDVCMPWHKDLSDFLVWMGSQTHQYKILVAGNHDKLIQQNKSKYLKICREQGIIYLEDSGVEIDGIKIWGTPWTPKRPKTKNSAFTLNRPSLMEKWNLIPADTNLLITHCPPYGIGDCNTDFYKGPPYQGGDYGLRKTINRLGQLKLHAFGHQHFGRGLYKSDTGVYFANSAVAQQAAAYVFT